ncbi:Predicted arabinose efflux permease, MFS family [Evansella caseinilytica]|uniref:Predicted arabinose efflux permease, MFS family n=1 Tax=Evansella caseinilytica TaxID=1503961 RepID=A0A1H3URA8_9BACI|nr:MFS transporter [Evansella caseinilytica]SDZ64299.1 Predicted arabinose efflux permease, MFS family [Evansella caseinilytica]
MKTLFFQRSFLFLWIAQSASGLGGTFAAFIMSWLVYDISGSKIAMSMIWICFMVPSLLTNLLAGPYIDRLQYKTVMIVSEWMRALAFFVPGMLLYIGQLPLTMLFLAAIVTGFAEPLFRPASMAYVAQILPKEVLQRGNSILEGTMQTMMLIGPALGGLMLTFFGPLFVITILITAVTLSGILLLFIESGRSVQQPIRSAWLPMFKEGIGFYKVYPVLFWIGILMLTVNFSTGAVQPMFLPYVLEHLNGTEFQYGLFMSLFSCGMVLGSFITGYFKQPKNLRFVMLGSLTMSGFALVLLGIITNIWIAITTSMLQGIFAVIFTINNTTFYQKRVPEHIRGRVFTVRALLAQSGIPIGAGLGGVLTQMYNFTFVFTLFGGVIIVATIVAWRAKIFHQLNMPPVEVKALQEHTGQHKTAT